MTNYPFTLSLNPKVQVDTTDDSYVLGVSPSTAPDFALPIINGIGEAIAQLQAGHFTHDKLLQSLENSEEENVREQFDATLQQLDEQGYLNYAVLPLAIAIPTEKDAALDLNSPNWGQAKVSLLPSVSQSPYSGKMVLESPHSKYRVELQDWRASALVAQLAQPQSLQQLTPPPQLGPETAYQFLNLLWATGFLSTEGDDSEEVTAERPELSLPETLEVNESISEVLAENSAVDGAIASHEDETEEEVETTPVEEAIEQSEKEDNTPISEITISEQTDRETVPEQTTALYPHDLDDRISGLAELRNQTLGDPRITIAILGGDPDHSLSCFEGADISKVFPNGEESTAPIAMEDYQKFQAISSDESLDQEAKAEAITSTFSEQTLSRIYRDNDACHATSTIVGQPNTSAPGLAPNCRVINVPLTVAGDEEFITPANLAHALEQALDLDANIVHCSAYNPTSSEEGKDLLLNALEKCQQKNVLVISPTGNNQDESVSMAAFLPGVLSVGALTSDGLPYKYSHGTSDGNSALEGIMVPGSDILGAQPANEAPIRLQGASVAAPVMTGLSGLLMSLQLQRDKPIDAEAVRAALLNTAIPCNPETVEEPDLYLQGTVNLPSAMKLLFDSGVTISFAGDRVTRTEHQDGAIASAIPSLHQPTEIAPLTTSPDINSTPAAPNHLQPTNVKPSTAFSGHVYALGTLGYDFGDEARRDTFKQTMAPTEVNGVMVPGNPYDIQQMIEHLDQNPDAAHSLIWTLSLDQNTIYVLEPKGPFADDTYEMFLLMLAGQNEPIDSPEFIERISIPARRTHRTAELFSGEMIPVVNVLNPRGMYGWTIPSLVDNAIATVLDETADTGEATVNPETLREGLTAFLNRVYYDLHNVGQTSRDRALNFAVTNTFQATSAFTEAIASGRKLDTIDVEKSPYCRLNSDCWDVLLTFFDPEHGRRSRQVFRFTLDVSDNIPVTVGKLKRWSIPGKQA
ncbi:peptidase S8 and S53 subtilisin kexin sedolisin [[Leptolyngbya] sp. PCC 7376]|uniref:PatA/PatG family cyanobactin maturation protease n=1 Tax=[Leptolyngbya] sp. PCC 7376 TaxID=111781 RepID=UPI00029EE607|nr:PatA/PatG family cyanobactin maturation protease [[Leptolyngbya] sp. PCC 7376]AFY37270.1 peptidase S8 and S53 subtilisin kexin sedolisin [[Leptolyngbya] sp. PCC 7376]